VLTSGCKHGAAEGPSTGVNPETSTSGVTVDPECSPRPSAMFGPRVKQDRHASPIPPCHAQVEEGWFHRVPISTDQLHVLGAERRAQGRREAPLNTLQVLCHG